MRHRFYQVATPAIACALLAASASCGWLGPGDPDPLHDAAVDDAAPLPLGDAGPDLYEPNDTPETAIDLDPGVHNFSIAPQSDVDYWQLILAAESDVTIGLRFPPAADLDLELYSINELDMPLAWSRGTNDREQIVRTTAENGTLGPGVFLVRVFAFNGEGTANYELSLAVQ